MRDPDSRVPEGSRGMMALRVIQGDNHVPRVLFSLPTSPISDYFLSKAHLTVLDNGSMLVSLLRRPKTPLPHVPRGEWIRSGISHPSVEGKIDLVITDVMMPLVTGPELAAWVRHVWPHISVLFVLAFFHPSRLELSRRTWICIS
jgi:CheY-like chemotaxis protein